jgi:hypothetical protein
MNSQIPEPLAPNHPAQRLYYLLLIGWLTLVGPTERCPAQATGSTAPSTAPAGGFSGKVVETMNSGGYTYALVDAGDKKLWAAAPQFSLKVGDSLAVADPMPMPNYHSKTLNRDFELVYFTGNVKVNGIPPGTGTKSVQLPKNHPPIAGATAKPTINLSGIKKAAGGKTIAEIFVDKAKLKGKQVKVRGRVVKYNGDIMGKNWIHIQDRTGSADSNDLTVTTASKAKVGDTVLVTGTVATDRDFGSSYTYSVMIEDAKLTVE